MKKTTTLPKGEYYIGDPCYAFDGLWSDVLNQTNYFNKEDAKINKIPVFGGSTAYGDGLYIDKQDNQYPVDAGIIACIPVKLLKLDNKLTKEKIISDKYGRVEKFKEPFVCTYEEGVFTFGGIEIDTAGQEEEDEECCPHCGR